MDRGMFFKIGALLIAGGVTACALLVMRQSRIQAAHEIARAQLRIRDLDAELWELRPQIAARVAPENVRSFVEDLGTMRGILPEAVVSPEVQRQIDAWRARTRELGEQPQGRSGTRPGTSTNTPMRNPGPGASSGPAAHPTTVPPTSSPSRTSAPGAPSLPRSESPRPGTGRERTGTALRMPGTGGAA